MGALAYHCHTAGVSLRRVGVLEFDLGTAQLASGAVKRRALTVLGNRRPGIFAP
jgi:hypothetical protein